MPTIPIIVGVDTHRDTHAVCVCDAGGRVLWERTYETTAVGLHTLRKEVEKTGHAQWAIECTSTYGLSLVAELLEHDHDVYQAVRPNKKLRRGGKTDRVDAHAAALSLIAGGELPRPRASSGALSDLRLYAAARRSASKSQAEALTQLKSLIVLCPEIREQFRGVASQKLITTCSKWRPRPEDHARIALKALAIRILTLRTEAEVHEEAMRALVTELCPELLAAQGIGPVAAATLLLAVGDNAARMQGPDSFAALCGTTPIQASSGQTTKYRLNRAGDRQANCVLHRAVLIRMRLDPRTQAYLAKCTARGKTKKDATRLLKTYLARELYGIIEAHSKNLTS